MPELPCKMMKTHDAPSVQKVQSHSHACTEDVQEGSTWNPGKQQQLLQESIAKNHPVALPAAIELHMAMAMFTSLVSERCRKLWLATNTQSLRRKDIRLRRNGNITSDQGEQRSARARKLLYSQPSSIGRLIREKRRRQEAAQSPSDPVVTRDMYMAQVLQSCSHIQA